MMRVPTIPLVVSSFSLFLSFAWAQPDETRVADPLDGRLAAYFQLGGEQSTWHHLGSGDGVYR